MNYEHELTDIAERLRSNGISASVQLADAASFVLAELGTRTVEISRSGQDWWMEFWDGETVVRDQYFGTVEKVISTADWWLKNTEGS